MAHGIHADDSIAIEVKTPASNQVGGFKESVSKAYRKCRQYLATHDMIQEKVSSNKYLLS